MRTSLTLQWKKKAKLISKIGILNDPPCSKGKMQLFVKKRDGTYAGGEGCKDWQETGIESVLK